ncbi:Stk1 family PASTA domain-containing Ser/Thr kinase [Streptomyces sp. LHD-70]|uniref:Stk1 family PASTA domain-containing Ser/Thr kinase n=1 Tax=Streptomyces sp. LHD-70 TaxID=3072140 RepID=UPI00280EA62C|nr:Stk1 family PASTA domain-containing Ser/Thr kinase [Streptomyces sp. LHD-70]MDQ8701480.1 Stk1 family PASTA domain-containing Ser/Thr kinase [Streptomyces sp. LHD-70]
MDTTLQDPLVGQVLDDRYRIDARVAVGGMATVYRAVDTRLDRVLALKVMHPTLAADASFVERFIREAKSVARLSHPNVVGVYDQGADGAYVYLAMEYVAGCTLRDVLRERGALQPRAALDILEPVLAALGAAHRAGFVHRDMKPENVLIGDDGRVKVADFGLVRAVDTVTNTTGAVLGTVSYLAPEQIENGTADPRVDVYACGVVLYEMLTGAKPHTGDSPAQVLYRHLNEDVPPPSATVPGLPVDLDELTATATARNPDVRPHDAVALLSQTRQARASLTDEQLDALPPGALAEAHDNADDRTSVIPRALGSVPRPLPAEQQQLPEPADGSAEDRMNRTSRLEVPPPAEPTRTSVGGPGNRRRPSRTVLALLVALLTLGVGVGVWYINSGQFTRVPALLTKTESQARKALSEAGLDVREVERKYSTNDKRGTVMATDPKAGSRIRDNGRVTLTVSLGPRIVTVPDVKSTQLEKAKNDLRDRGLEPGMVTRQFSDAVERGAVISTDPAASSKVKPGTAVAITVSKGSPVDIPNVVGDSLDDARAELQEAGLKVEVAPERVFSEEDKGTIAVQRPGEGARLAHGDTVKLTVSKGPDMVEVPDVSGLSKDEAKEKLEAAGFKVDVQRWFVGDTVWDQSPGAGEQAPRGSEVTIRTR